MMTVKEFKQLQVGDIVEIRYTVARITPTLEQTSTCRVRVTSSLRKLENMKVLQRIPNSMDNHWVVMPVVYVFECESITDESTFHTISTQNAKSGVLYRLTKI